MEIKHIPSYPQYYSDRNGNIYSFKSGALKKIYHHVNHDGYIRVVVFKDGKTWKHV